MEILTNKNEIIKQFEIVFDEILSWNWLKIKNFLKHKNPVNLD